MRTFRATRYRTRLLAPIVGAAAAAVALIAAAPPPATLPGMTYTMHSAVVPTGDGPGADAMEAMRSGFTAVIVFAAGRGRMDITEGAQAKTFEKGDFILFDSGDYIIVRPSEKHFFGLPADMMTNASNAMQSTGMKMTIKNMVASLDTLGPGETVAGFPTQHYRTTISYTMVMDMSGMGIDLGNMAPPPMETKQTTDMWFAEIADFPNNPLAGMATGMKKNMAAAPGGMGGMMKDLTDKMEEVQAQLPKDKTSIKTVSSTRMAGMMGMGMDMTTEMSNIKKTDVDVDQLVLPDGFTQIAMPGMEALVSSAPLPADGGAKWRVKPGGGR